MQQANHIAHACLSIAPSYHRRVNSLLLIGGRIIDPANKFDAIADLLIINGKISAVGKNLPAPKEIENLMRPEKLFVPA
ncbi:MAG: hypothetical protein WDM76_08415 [Limisphaerales bacterium]